MANKKTAVLIFFAVFLFIIVRLIQLILIKILPPTGMNFLLNFFSFQIYYNSGLAFGLPFSNNLLIIVSLLIIIYFINLFWQYLEKDQTNKIIPLILILVGAFSNLIERIKYGYVIDYFLIWILPIFNLADLFIFSGVIWLLIILLKKPKT